MRLLSTTRHPILLMLSLLAFTALLLLQPAHAESRLTPIASPADNNQYRYLTLDNGLEILLISDPGADKAAASMNIPVGSGDDPADREGMAHFLEHMLFLGTEKYPDPGEYQQFIRSHGGSHNAFTAFQDTNYFFDIQPDHLEPALDRFAQQFSAPLFTPELVDQERNAVHSEFTASLKEDGRRYFSVRKALTHPDHGFSQFAVGNLTTLANDPERPLRDDLIDFWRTHYSANLMTLAVYGPQSLDELEAMVRPRFGAIENRNLTMGEHPAPLFPEGFLPARVQIETLRDIRTLRLVFPLPSQQDKYRNKPVHYVANLLGHEGPGSLFDRLKSQGLVESLSAGTGTDTGRETTLELIMNLTEQGLTAEDDIIALTFDYIDLVRNQGIDRFRFEEGQQLAELDFRFQERPQPLHLVMRLSMQMGRVAPEDVLRAAWMMENYVPEDYRDILDRLTPDNLLVTLQSPEPLPEDALRTVWYNTPYMVNENFQAPRATELSRQLASELQLPEPNPFIPEDLDMLPGDAMAHPQRLAQLGVLDVWHARDTRFNRPEANLFLSLRSPETTASAQGHVLTRLLTDSITTTLNPWAYPAQMAGLDYSVYPHLRGITVRVGGYHDTVPVLTSRILSQLAAPHITEQRFRIARAQYIDALRNSLRERPVGQAASLVQDALIEGAWTTEEKLAAAEQVTVDQLRAFAERFTDQADATLLVHGNITEAFALNTARLANAMLLHDTQAADVRRSAVRQLPDGETRLLLPVPHPDTGYLRYSQGPATGLNDRAAYRLLTQIVSSPFYEELRTQRQLGYIVYATSFEMLETPAIALVVQSPEASADDIDEAVTAFSRRFERELEAMTEADLNREKQAVISRLLQQERRLSEVSQRYWQEIDRQVETFDSRQQLAEAVRNVSREDLIQAYRDALLDYRASLLVVTEEGADRPDEQILTLRGQPVIRN